MNNPQYELEMEVRDYELDCQGIVNNSVYQNYLEHTRHKFLHSLGVSFSKLHEEGIDAVVAKVEIAYKSSLSGDDKFVVQLRTVKEGIKYVFHEDILRLPERTLCIRAKIETVIVEQGRLSKGDRFNFLLPEAEDAVNE